MNLAPLSWHGPVTSGYGLHAVYIHERLDARLPDFSEISDQLKFDWMAEKQREITRRAYKEIRSRYRVLVENMPYDLDVHG
jgi:parvulin-like peptidyl-prolyl isomerase